MYNFAPKKQPFLTKSALYIWLSTKTQNGKYIHFQLTLPLHKTKKISKIVCNYDCQSCLCKHNFIIQLIFNYLGSIDNQMGNLLILHQPKKNFCYFKSFPPKQSILYNLSLKQQFNPQIRTIHRGV